MANLQAKMLNFNESLKYLDEVEAFYKQSRNNNL